jgi:hypothetical protein
VATLAAIPRAAGDAVSTFIYPTGKGNLTFALSAAHTGDVYMRLSGPALYQWVGVGTGSEMKGSVMFILYQNADRSSESSCSSTATDDTHRLIKSGVTLSPRLSEGHSEPSFNDKIDCILENNTTYHGSVDHTNDNRYYSADIRCKNITALGGGNGQLDLNNARQPFIYAWGPIGDSIATSSKSASIKRHQAYGNFWMDMTKATTSTSEDIAMPADTSLVSMTNAGDEGQAESDGDTVGPTHAAITLVAFAIIFPLGAILLRFLDSVKAHYIVQTIGALAAIAGVVVGIYLSKMYNHVCCFKNICGCPSD